MAAESAKSHVAASQVEPPSVTAGSMAALLHALARPSRAAEPPPVMLPGDRLGRFEIVREIGRGGCGAVYEARDQLLGRRVALKRVHAGALRDDERGGPAGDEAEAAAQLQHPNIVSLFDVGLEEGAPYLVLELLEGETLRDLLHRRRLHVEEVLRIAVPIARAMAHAHARGVVHRDLKPANVFVCRDGTVKVLDFGLSWTGARATKQGGTPGYMAPEQQRGDPEDARTDVYAFGVLLTELLGGAARAARAPAALAAVASRARTADPRERQADGAQVLLGLEAAARSIRARRVVRMGTTAAVAVIAIGMGAVALVPRKPAPLVVPAPHDGRHVTMIAPARSDFREAEFGSLDKLLATALEQAPALSVVGPSRVLDVASQEGVATRGERLSDADLQQLARRLGASTVVIPELRRTGGALALSIRALDADGGAARFTAEDLVRDSRELVGAVDRLAARVPKLLGVEPDATSVAPVSLESGVTSNLEAYYHFARGLDLNSQYGELGEAVVEWEKAVALDPTFAAAHQSLAYAATIYGRFEDGRRHREIARDHAEQMPFKERTTILLQAAAAAGERAEVEALAARMAARFPQDKAALFASAQSLWVVGAPDKAEPYFRRTLALDPGYYCAAGDFTRLLSGAGRVDEAVTVARRAVSEKPTHTHLALLAVTLARAGALEDAVEWSREALRRSPAPNVNVAYMVGAAFARSGQFDEARATYQRLVDAGRGDDDRVYGLGRLAELAAYQGRLREALRLCAELGPRCRFHGPGLWRARVQSVGRDRLEAAEALETVRSLGGNDRGRAAELAFFGDGDLGRRVAQPLDRSSPEHLHHRAVALADEGRWDEAIEAQRTLLAMARYGQVSFSIEARYLLGETLHRAGRPAEAAEVLAPLEHETLYSAAPADLAANGPRGLLVRAHALERLGQPAEALRVLEGLEVQWRDADPDLPLVAEVRSMRQRLTAAPR